MIFSDAVAVGPCHATFNLRRLSTPFDGSWFLVRSFEGRASNHVCRVTHARACSEGRDGTVGGHSLWHMVHVDVHHVSVMREVTRRREGEEVEGETTRATKPGPFVCYLHTPLARYGPPPRPPACPATFSRIILRSRRVIIGSVESSCRWTRANAGFGEIMGMRVKSAVHSRGLGGRIGRHGSRSGSLRCMCGGGFVGSTGTSGRGRSFGHIGP